MATWMIPRMKCGARCAVRGVRAKRPEAVPEHRAPNTVHRLLLFIALAAAAVRPALAQSAPPTPVSSGRPLAPDGSLRIFVLNGSVRVTGWDRDSVAVSGTAGKGQELFMGGTRSTMKLGLWDRADAANALPSHIEVRVPAGARVWVKTGYDADVDVAGVTGGLDLNTAAGDVRVAGSPRELTVEAMEGSIEIAGSPAWLRAKSATGSITLRGSSEDAVLTTVSGPITVVAPGLAAPFGRSRFESVTGNVAFSGAPARGGTLDVDTHSGAVDLALPASLGADFDVTTIAGSVTNALTAARPVAEARRRALVFSTGEGGAHITVRTFKGPVRLRRQ